jgi:very-short-patch-repair endonuclease
VHDKRSEGWNKRSAPLLAARQHGAIRTSQLGLSRATITRWVRDGRLHPKHRGVYAYGHPHLSREGTWMAAQLAAGDDSTLAELCAASMWKVTKWEPREIVLLVPKQRRAQPGFRTRLCRNLDPRDVTVRNGIRVTTPARTFIDLIEVMAADDLAFVMHEAAYRGLFDLQAVRAARARANGRRNVAVFDEALDMHLSGSAGTRSRLEKRVRKLVRGAGLPAPRINTHVNGLEVDFFWPSGRLCVEIDGDNHKRARTRVDDRFKDAALRAAGYTVLRFTEDELNLHPDTFVAHVAAALEDRMSAL